MGMKMLTRYSWLRITSVVGCCKYSTEHMGCIKIRKQIESLSKFTCLDKTLTSKKTVNGVLHDIVHKLFTKAFFLQNVIHFHGICIISFTSLRTV
jgi:hypothetical protein